MTEEDILSVASSSSMETCLLREVLNYLVTFLLKLPDSRSESGWYSHLPSTCRVGSASSPAPYGGGVRHRPPQLGPTSAAPTEAHPSRSSTASVKPACN